MTFSSPLTMMVRPRMGLASSGKSEGISRPAIGATPLEPSQGQVVTPPCICHMALRGMPVTFTSDCGWMGLGARAVAMPDARAPFGRLRLL